MSEAPHIPVLLAEVLAALQPIAGGVFYDGTFGAGGYTRALLEAGAARVIAVDRDPTAISAGQAMVNEMAGRLTLLHGRFSDVAVHLAAAGVTKLDGAVFDVGVSSMQLDQAERGFSFRADGPLDMRMSLEGLSAADVVNRFAVPDLAHVLRAFGEEKHAGRIARAIDERRRDKPFERTGELVATIEKVMGAKRFGELHPATRSFQAIRILVNGELDELTDALGASEAALADGGRLAVVSFHSLEDRIVKRFFADRSRTTAQGSRHLPDIAVPPATFAMAGRQPVEAGEDELSRNPRARSAKLRFGTRTAAPARPVDRDLLGVPAFTERHTRGTA